MSGRLYHGGIPGLTPGDRIEPAPNTRHREGCPICAARAEGQTLVIDGQAVDGPTGRHDAVYVTSDRLYAKFYASMAAGDLYSVEPVGEVGLSPEDPMIESFTCAAATVDTVVERSVVLTEAELRRLWRRMGGTSRGWRQMAMAMPEVMRTATS